MSDSVREKIETAYKMLLKNDSYLLEVDANERSITHKFAEYLQQIFPQYHVDCEYNRDGHDSKRLIVELNNLSLTEKDSFDTVYPDIIIHKRGSDINYIVIEAKKENNEKSYERDKNKLIEYKNILKYQYAFLVLLKNKINSFDVNDFVIEINK